MIDKIVCGKKKTGKPREKCKPAHCWYHSVICPCKLSPNFRAKETWGVVRKAIKAARQSVCYVCTVCALYRFVMPIPK